MGKQLSGPLPQDSGAGGYFEGLVDSATGTTYAKRARNLQTAASGDTAGMETVLYDTNGRPLQTDSGNNLLVGGGRIAGPFMFSLTPPAAPGVAIGTGGTIGAAIAAPVAPTPSTTTTGGTIAAGTYGVKISYVNPAGETVVSVNGPITTTGTTSTITIPTPAASGDATAWYAYVTQVGGATYTRQQTAGSPTSIGQNLILTAPPTNTGAAPPGSNTAWQSYSLGVSYVNANGETIMSVFTSVTPTSSTASLTVTSPVASGSGPQVATGWYVYSTPPGGGSYTRQQTAGSPTAITTNLTLTSISNTGANPLTSNGTALAAATSYTSAQQTSGSATHVSGLVVTDQPGTLFVDHSADGTNYDYTSPFSISSNQGESFDVLLYAPYWRLRYANNQIAGQTTFRLYSFTRTVS